MVNNDNVVALVDALLPVVSTVGGAALGAAIAINIDAGSASFNEFISEATATTIMAFILLFITSALVIIKYIFKPELSRHKQNQVSVDFDTGSSVNFPVDTDKKKFTVDCNGDTAEISIEE